MSKVERVRSWCSFDRLDGKRLQNGERLRVTWPDGRTTTELVILRQWSESISDHGHASDYPQEKAVVYVMCNGQRVEAPLAGMEAERV